MNILDGHSSLHCIRPLLLLLPLHVRDLHIPGCERVGGNNLASQKQWEQKLPAETLHKDTAFWIRWTTF